MVRGWGMCGGQSECATASTMMTHLVLCETEAFNWHCSHEERADFPLALVRERDSITIKKKKFKKNLLLCVT